MRGASRHRESYHMTRKARKQIKHLKFDSHLFLADGGVGNLFQILPCSQWGLRLDKSRQKFLEDRLASTGCSHCGGDMRTVYHLPEAGADMSSVTAQECAVCGFWRAAHSGGLTGVRPIVPFVKSFCPQRHITALTALMEEVRRQPSRVYTIEPSKFELLVGSILGDYFNCEVLHVGQPHDGGIDLILIAADEPVMVQVKRRARADRAEGIDVVKHLFASMLGRGHGMVVTTAQR